MEFYEALNKRFSVKQMNGQEISEEKMERILEAARLAPTSMGLQPMKIIMIKDRNLIDRIAKESCFQPQIPNCSSLMLIAARDGITQKELDDYIELIMKTRGVPKEKLEGLIKLSEKVQNMDRSEFLEWSMRQTYIVLGFVLAAAAVEEVGSVPLKGFKAQQLDDILGLTGSGLTSSLLIAFGECDTEKDPSGSAPKIRKLKEDFIEYR